MVLAALRATQPTVTNITTINSQLNTLGQALFNWNDPDGYPDNVDWWAGTILQRWNFNTFLTALTTGGVVVSVTSLMQTNTADAIAEAINKQTFAGQMPATLKQHITSYLGAAAITTTRVREALALAMSSTAFQWY
jgi:hypothetical protein